MFFAHAMRAIVAMVALWQQFSLAMTYKADAPGSSEYLAGIVTNATADLYAHYRGLMDARDERMALPPRSAIAGRIGWFPPDLIMLALSAVEALELTIGFGEPYRGFPLKVSWHQFSALQNRLASASPDSSWQGIAAQDYARRNDGQQNRALAMADLDRRLADLVQDHADQVTHVRLAFGILKYLLIFTCICDVFLLFTQRDPEAKLVAYRAASFGVIAATAMVSYLHMHAEVAALSIELLTGRYHGLAAGALLPASS